MLILSRTVEESIVIGDSIEITVLEVKGDRVRLGISAPRSLPVHRKEIYEAIEAENRRAASSTELDPSSLGQVIQSLKKRNNLDSSKS